LGYLANEQRDGGEKSISAKSVGLYKPYKQNQERCLYYIYIVLNKFFLPNVILLSRTASF